MTLLHDDDEGTRVAFKRKIRYQRGRTEISASQIGNIPTYAILGSLL